VPLEPSSFGRAGFGSCRMPRLCFRAAKPSGSAYQTDDPYSDVVVHEAAHMLHYLKPSHYGLQVRRGQERFVDTEFRHRELFAYACEAYSRVVLLGDLEREALDNLGAVDTGVKVLNLEHQRVSSTRNWAMTASASSTVSTVCCLRGATVPGVAGVRLSERVTVALPASK